MSKKYIFTTIIIAGLIASALCALQMNNKASEADEWSFLYGEDGEDDYYFSNYDGDEEETETEADAPLELDALLPGASWSIDTICTVDEVTYLYASDNDLRTNAICTEGTLLVEDPSLTYLEMDTPAVIQVMAGEKTLIVDFRNPSSIEQLRTLNSPLMPGWKRYRWDRKADFCDQVMNYLEIDYPKSSIAHSENIRPWLR